MNKKWLFSIGLAIMAPAVLALWLGLIDQIASGDTSVTVTQGGRFPSRPTTGVDTIIITLLGTGIWLGGVWKVAQMWRGKGPGGG
ncbi:hypothetical protein [Acuticoccus kandeliae]|uniref:hypothetical protein n=1 Tax=Acuticoccus kandeliae TaxID=2073160 RepID=UPI000D3EBB77|nr:hypothetical protein [Acuticoccus kandeliae]